MPLALIAACANAPGPAPLAPEARFAPEAFADVLDLTGVPADARDLSPSVFSDLGAWHGFGLPPEASGEQASGEIAGGFTGPFVMFMDNGTWAGPSLARLTVSNHETGERLDLSRAAHQSTAFPGRLHQTLQIDGLAITLDLVFVTSRSALIRAHVANESETDRPLVLGWTGTVFDSTLTLSASGATVVGTSPEATVVLASPEARPTIQGDVYTLDEATRHWLLPAETLTTVLAVSAYESDADRAADQVPLAEALAAPEAVSAANEARWSGYLDAVLSAESAWLEDLAYQRAAVKAVQTLITNWRSPAGDLHHSGLFPSVAYRGFHGVWSWDSWKHAVALARFAPDLAKDQVRVMFDHQNAAGMVPDVIYRDGTENNWRDTKPPLATWAVHSIVEASGDAAFAAEMLPRLIRYHRWWDADRDHDRDGLAEYGSTDGTRIAAAWESGMDNAVRFDDAVMVQNSPTAWSLNQESVDLNAYLYAEKRLLAALLDGLGRDDDARGFRDEAEALRQRIQSGMLDAETGLYHDIRLDGTPVRVLGPEIWTPLWTGVATPDEASGARAVMVDSATFATHVPFPTLAANHPDFDPTDGYWRGPVWLDQATFAIQGLRRYGYNQEADAATRALLANARGLTGSAAPIYENYHPHTGEGLNAAHFSWSAAHLLMLLTGDTAP